MISRAYMEVADRSARRSSIVAMSVSFCAIRKSPSVAGILRLES